MTSEIDKLKHFHVENYSGTNLELLKIQKPLYLKMVDLLVILV